MVSSWPKKWKTAKYNIVLQARVSELQTEERRLRESLDTATSRAQVLLLISISINMNTFLVSIFLFLNIATLRIFWH